MRIIFYGRTHKEIESITDCQDYLQINEESGCIAIADGAGQSFYPSMWADLLVNHFCQNSEINEENWKEWLQPIQEKWLLEVEERVKKAKAENRPTWIESQNGLNARRPATSTFIGLQFRKEEAKVCIVGDSCLFILKGNQIETHLLKSSKDFNDRPEYFASYVKDNHFQPKFLNVPLDYEALKAEEKIYFILATDALSEYIFKCIENKTDIFKYLLETSSQKKFEDFVTSARSNQNIKMKSDDVALIVLYLDSETKSLYQSCGESRKRSQLDEDHLSNSETKSLELRSNSNRLTQENKSFISALAQVLSFIPFFKKKSNIQRNLPSLVSKVPSSSVKKVSELQQLNALKQQRAVLIKQKTALVRQRAVLVILVTLLSSFIVVNAINVRKSNQSATQTTANIPPRFINIQIGTPIYKDQRLSQVLIESLYAQSEVLILEEGDKWIKFQADIYAYQSIINQCSNCSEIEIQPNKNLRLFPSQLERDIFGQLQDRSSFEKLEFNSIPAWYKFRLVGYIRK